MKRIYHPYWLWEDYKAGMWNTLPKSEEPEFLQRAIEFTGNHILYGSFMVKVSKEWKYSCEHNLTNTSMNRKAWIGHASVAMAFGCPEAIVRSAWWKLSDKQRELANNVAQKAIEKWEKKFNSL